MDALILSGWMLLAVALYARRRRLGRLGWCDWQSTTALPDPDDGTLALGRRALAAVQAYGQAQGDRREASRVDALAGYTEDVFSDALLERLRLGQFQVRLLALASQVPPLPARELHDPWLRALAHCGAWLGTLPGRPRTLVRLRRQLGVLRAAVSLQRWRRARLADRPRALARLDVDLQRLEQAVGAAQDALDGARQARREQLHGRRH